jgi:uncharacterized membrane protein
MEEYFMDETETVVETETAAEAETVVETETAAEAETVVETKTAIKTESKGNDNIMAAVAYLLGFVSGIIIYLIEKDKPDRSRYVMFHAVQAIILGVVWFIIAFIPIIGQLVIFISWVVMMYKAYSGEEYHLPVIGDYAEKYI